MSSVTSTTQLVRGFLIDEFLSPEDAEDLQGDTDLFSTGILDSLGTLKLITFLEGEFSITIEPSEATQETLQTVTKVVELVDKKC